MSASSRRTLSSSNNSALLYKFDLFWCMFSCMFWSNVLIAFKMKRTSSTASHDEWLIYDRRETSYMLLLDLNKVPLYTVDASNTFGYCIPFGPFFFFFLSSYDRFHVESFNWPVRWTSQNPNRFKDNNRDATISQPLSLALNYGELWMMGDDRIVLSWECVENFSGRNEKYNSTKKKICTCEFIVTHCFGDHCFTLRSETFFGSLDCFREHTIHIFTCLEYN